MWCETQGYKHLFPCEQVYKGGYDPYGKRFNSYKRKLGIIKEFDNHLLDFHSYRHTIETKLGDAGFNQYDIDDVIGHESNSIGRSTYSHSNRTKRKVKAIESIKYPIGFDKIKPWNECIFYYKPFRQKKAQYRSIELKLMNMVTN